MFAFPWMTQQDKHHTMQLGVLSFLSKFVTNNLVYQALVQMEQERARQGAM